MMHLRRLAVFVDETDDGQFDWLLIECSDDTGLWADLRVSARSYPTWIAAYDAGTVELMKVVDDERIGPRAEDDEDAAPVG